MIICQERGADLHTAQLTPLLLTVSCFSKIQIGFAFLVVLDKEREREIINHEQINDVTIKLINSCGRLPARKIPSSWPSMRIQIIWAVKVFLKAGCPSCCPTNSVEALKGRGREETRTDCFLNLRGLGPDVGDESGVAVAADAVLEAGGQLGLAEWNVVATAVRQRHDHLLEETQRLVDVHRFLLRLPLRLYNQVISKSNRCCRW